MTSRVATAPNASPAAKSASPTTGNVGATSHGQKARDREMKAGDVPSWLLWIAGIVIAVFWSAEIAAIMR